MKQQKYINLKEKPLQEKLAGRLSAWFDVELEVWSTCAKGRIDIVLRCKKSGAIFGIEMKQVNKKTGNDMGEYLLQAAKYSMCNFKTRNLGHTGRIPIFIYPAISYDYLICPDEMITIKGMEYFKDRHDKNAIHHTIQGFFGVFNVGELRVYEWGEERYIRFAFNNKQIWTNALEWGTSDIIGLHEINYNDLITRTNDYDIQRYIR